MKTADIEANKAYVAKVGYYGSTKVTVLEAGLPIPQGYKKTSRNIGVRVRLEEDVQWGRLKGVAGEERVITQRQVEREWIEADDRARAEAAVEAERQKQITRRLGEAGYAPYEHDVNFDGEDFVDIECGDFKFDGDWLELSPKLTADLLDLAGL